MNKNIYKYDEPKKLCFREGNPKTDKNRNIEGLDKYWILRLNLAPADLSGFNTCSSASPGCKKACLHGSGNPVFMDQKNLGRINRTRFYFRDRAKFLTKLIKEITNHELYCNKNGFKAVVRLNTTSDIPWEIHKIFQLFPNINFYDYTKEYKRMNKFLEGKLPSNYHLTFSRTEKEENHLKCKDVLKRGGNIAVVFRKNLPEYFEGYKVVNGDSHDLRFTDPKNVVVGLIEKPTIDEDTKKKIRDYSGFVID